MKTKEKNGHANQWCFSVCIVDHDLPRLLMMVAAKQRKVQFNSTSFWKESNREKKSGRLGMEIRAKNVLLPFPGNDPDHGDDDVDDDEDGTKA